MLRLAAYVRWRPPSCQSHPLRKPHPIPPYASIPAAPAGKYPALSEAQAHKLRLLSVVSAADGARTLAYDDLLASLQLPSVRALEDLLIAHCLYGGLLRGKLDQRNK